MATGSIVRWTHVKQVASDPDKWAIGRPENADAKPVWRLLRALQAQLRLREAYGVDDHVSAESRQTVNLFQALLSLNLMSVFFQQDFLAAFADRRGIGDWVDSAAAPDHGRAAGRSSEPVARSPGRIGTRR
ncbi:MAG: hypothetical protein IPJ97_17600 [Proteobacteria bacterium]|nr:hypothetical protein [Pseudomonadota bacterium]